MLFSISNMSATVSAWLEKERQSIEKWAKDPVDKEENHLVISALESLLNGQLSMRPQLHELMTFLHLD